MYKKNTNLYRAGGLTWFTHPLIQNVADTPDTL